MKRIKTGFWTLVMIASFAGGILAQAPGTITYQGRLTNTAGDPITTTQTVSFLIYSSPTSGTLLWSETLTIDPDVQGVFTTELGTITPMGQTLFNGAKRYLTLKVGSDAEMSPRQLLNSAPYAISAENIPAGSVTSERIAPGAVVTSSLGDGVVTSVKIADNSLRAVDQLDEAGLTFKMSLPANSFRPLPPTGTDSLTSITVQAPAAGFIYVWAMTNISLDHISGTRDWLWCQVTPDPDTIIPNSYGFAMINLPAELPTNASYVYPLNVHRPFQILGAGSYTYYFNAKMFSGGGNNDQFHSLQMTAMYFPTAYGNVNQQPPLGPADTGNRLGSPGN